MIGRKLKLTVEALSPVHVTGETIYRTDLLGHGGKICRIDTSKIARLASNPYELALGKITLDDLIDKARKMPERDLVKMCIKRPWQKDVFIKDGDSCFGDYETVKQETLMLPAIEPIPASTIKGMLRTVFLNYLIYEHRDKSYIESFIKKDYFKARNKAQQIRQARRLESHYFNVKTSLKSIFELLNLIQVNMDSANVWTGTGISTYLLLDESKRLSRGLTGPYQRTEFILPYLSDSKEGRSNISYNINLKSIPSIEVFRSRERREFLELSHSYDVISPTSDGYQLDKGFILKSLEWYSKNLLDNGLKREGRYLHKYYLSELEKIAEDNSKAQLLLEGIKKSYESLFGEYSKLNSTENCFILNIGRFVGHISKTVRLAIESLGSNIYSEIEDKLSTREKRWDRSTLKLSIFCGNGKDKYVVDNVGWVKVCIKDAV